MKKQTLIIGLILITGLIFITACGGGPGASQTPSDVVKAAVENMAAGNFDTAISYYVTKKGEELTSEEKEKLMAFLPAMKQDIDNKGGIKEVVIIDEKIAEDGQSAEVKYYYVDGNGEKSKENRVKLLLVNGVWRVRVN